MALVALVRFARRYRKTATVSDRLMTDGTVLRGVGRELAAVRRERDRSGWSPDLAGRALAALRIAGTYMLGRPVSLLPANKLSAEGRGRPGGRQADSESRDGRAADASRSPAP